MPAILRDQEAYDSYTQVGQDNMGCFGVFGG